MARDAIATKETVYAIALDLKREGLKPTPTLVRERLGNQGSFTTITRLLSNFAEEESHTTADIMDRVPEDIRSIMSTSFDGFVIQVWRNVEMHLLREKQALSEELQQAKHEADRLTKIVIDHEGMIETLRSECASQSLLAAGYLDDKRRSEAEARRFMDECERLRSEISSLTEVRIHLERDKAELQKERESLKAETGRMSEDFSTKLSAAQKEKEGLMGEISRLKESIIHLEHDKADLKNAAETLAGNLQREQASLEKARSEADSLVQENEGIRKESASLRESIIHLERDKSELTKDLENIKSELRSMGEAQDGLEKTISIQSSRIEQLMREAQVQSEFERKMQSFLATLKVEGAGGSGSDPLPDMKALPMESDIQQ